MHVKLFFEARSPPLASLLENCVQLHLTLLLIPNLTKRGMQLLSQSSSCKVAHKNVELICRQLFSDRNAHYYNDCWDRPPCMVLTVLRSIPLEHWRPCFVCRPATLLKYFGHRCDDKYIIQVLSHFYSVAIMWKLVAVRIGQLVFVAFMAVIRKLGFNTLHIPRLFLVTIFLYPTALTTTIIRLTRLLILVLNCAAGQLYAVFKFGKN